MLPASRGGQVRRVLLHVPVEGVDEDRERQVALQLRGGAGEHQVAARVRPDRQLLEQRGLADPRLAGHRDHRRARPDRAGEGLRERELRRAPDEVLGNGHLSPP